MEFQAHRGGVTMNLSDIRSLFAEGTETYLVRDIWSEDEETIIGTEKLRIDNVSLLWGCEGFPEIPVHKERISISDNCIYIETLMPVEVLRAWKSYVVKYATENLLSCEINPELIEKMTEDEIIQAYVIDDPHEFSDNILRLMHKYDV